ncbi:SDR family oxidoreductase [Candidatus Merdisoma sp. JLR.KK011]|jgi:3-oxoacyl-[acyl-carrier protein] reductase|uniref:SDR family NAD(P)-dependent oxidoreductase n=1 Tax=Candidatus Merdisoma sp. JLR.KK011 TaxID=3114299 RepID=UPI002FF16515
MHKIGAFEGKRIFISGSSKGIGLAAANKFLEEGGTVVLNGRDKNRLRKISELLSEKYSQKVYTAPGDLTNGKDAYSVAERIKQLIGNLDIVVANVGNGKPEGENPLEPAEWKRFYDINVMSSINILNALYPIIRKQNQANVILLSSIAAKEKISAPCGYAAAKSAIVTLTRYLAQDWAADGIRVNCVMPGNIYFEGGRWEELFREDRDGVKAYISENVPMKRFGEPKDVAEAICFLASEKASFITGIYLPVDGGQLNII